MKTIKIIFLLSFITFTAVSQGLIFAKIESSPPTFTSFTYDEMFAPRVLTQAERESLVHSEAFRVKCSWAINDYAKYWYSHDGNALSDSDRKVWRERYPIYKSVVRAEWVDANLTQRFVNLSKEYQLDFGTTPTTDDIIAVLEANSKFDQLAGMYFNLITE